MATRLSTWGNALYKGDKIYPIVQRRKRWLTLSTVLVVISLALLYFNGLNPGIEFRGGTEYVVANVGDATTVIATDVIAEKLPDEVPNVSVVGSDSIRVHIGQIPQEQVQGIADALAEAYNVPVEQVSSAFIGPTWGADVSKKAIQGLLTFILIVSLVIGLYFRAWRMAAAAVLALLHDLIFTAGIYALVGFEVTPATVIGFLTILGFSLYDTVVVFDKVRENTAHVTTQTRYTYEELANLALNQTLVRSINTSVVALLPVASILFIGSVVLGAGTLKDISLALFVGMAVGTYSSIFVATPMEVAFRSREQGIKEHTAKVLALRESGAVPTTVDEHGIVRVGALAPGEHKGTSAQPKRKGRK